MNLDNIELIEPIDDGTIDDSPPEGVSPDLWKIWQDEEELKKDKFLWQLKRGMLGHNVGLDNGLYNVNKYIYGTHKARYYLVGAESSVGKCLGKGTKVVMFDGILKAVEDIQVGDQLMGPDGSPRNVLSTCTGKEQMYWIKQEIGIDYRVNESHILSLQYRPKTKYSSKVIPRQLHIKKSLRKRTYTLEQKFDREIINIPLTDLLQLNKSDLKQYQGWKALGIDFGTKQVSLDPYMLGVWLGDGTSSATAITNVEPEISDYIKSYCRKNRLNSRIKGKGSSLITVTLSAAKKLNRIDSSTNIILETFSKIGDAVPKYSKLEEYISRATKSGKIVGGFRWRWEVLNNTLLMELRKYNLLQNKHIPLDYKQSTKENRCALIAGLIDTDGHYDKKKGIVEIAQKREQLANDIALIVRSLGLYCSVNSKIATMKRVDGTVYKCEVFRVVFRHDAMFKCKVERKKFADTTNENPLGVRTGITIEKDVVDDYYGFVIDGDHLFLLEDFTVTHNTTISDFMYVLSAWFSAKKMGRRIKIFYFSFEIGKTEKLFRWCSYFIWIKFKVRLPSDYIQGRINGMLVTKEHERMILIAYAAVSEMMRDIVIIDDVVHPTKMFEAMVEEHFSKEGKVERADVPPEDKKKGKKGYVKGYQENDSDLITLKATDHIALAGHEMGLDTKGLMDKWSKYDIVLRNLFYCTIVNIQQFSTDMMGAYRNAFGKKTSATIAPQRIDFGDSKATFRDADVVFGGVKPQREMSDFEGFNLTSPYDGGLGEYFVAWYLMKNRYGPSNRMLPIFLDPIVGIPYDLPTTDLTNPFTMQEWVEKAKDIEKTCQLFAPKSK